MAKERILSPTLIPSTLWDSRSRTLTLPRKLAQAYIDLIDSNGLRPLAEARDANSSPVGGLSQEETDEHFAQAFDGSVARALLAILDPKAEAGTTSNTFLRTTAGNDATITDAPCGAGAVTLAFLCALAELREAQVLPRLPLRVTIVGGEISAPAAAYAGQLLEAVKTSLAEQAIFVEHEILHWDVTDRMSNTDLIKASVRKCSAGSRKLLVVANFNGFLEGNGKRKEAMPQLEELFRYASEENSFAVWIEPNMNRAVGRGGLFSAIVKFFTTDWHKHVPNGDPLDGQEAFISEAKYEHPLFSPKKCNVRLAVMPIRLERGT